MEGAGPVRLDSSVHRSWHRVRRPTVDVPMQRIRIGSAGNDLSTTSHFRLTGRGHPGAVRRPGLAAGTALDTGPAVLALRPHVTPFPCFMVRSYGTQALCSPGRLEDYPWATKVMDPVTVVLTRDIVTSPRGAAGTFRTLRPRHNSPHRRLRWLTHLKAFP